NAGIATRDDGYLIAATIYKPIPANGDAYLVKLDSNLSIQWQKNYRTDSTIYNTFYDAIETTDGGYAVAGGFDKINYRDDGFLLAKLNKNGITEWINFMDVNSYRSV